MIGILKQVKRAPKVILEWREDKNYSRWRNGSPKKGKSMPERTTWKHLKSTFKRSQHKRSKHLSRSLFIEAWNSNSRRKVENFKILQQSSETRKFKFERIDFFFKECWSFKLRAVWKLCCSRIPKGTWFQRRTNTRKISRAHQGNLKLVIPTR